MKLISMTDFVLKCRKNKDLDNIRRFWACERYANFLKQPLELWMFVPCDEDGNVLINPFAMDYHAGTEKEIKQLKYNKAKKRCLFEGLSLEMGIVVVKHENGWHQILADYEIQSNNIEYLLTKKNDFILTPTAIKQIGL